MPRMSADDVHTTLAALEAAGTAQNRKVYQRHGVTPPLFGVSYAILGKLSKKIGVDHALALGLWESGVHDARVLACMIADSSKATMKLLESWVKPIDNYVLSDALSSFAARAPQAGKLGGKWRKSKKEFVAATGWNVLAGAALHAEDFDEAAAEELIATIEATIHSAPNRTRHSMNQALIAVGVRNARLHELAVAAAKRIGEVQVDHGQTSCKTPDAVDYMAKTLAHRKAHPPKAKARAKSKSARKT
ncbi:MAG: DNA alkylation repair protein [Planctomycetota bacterium]|nr:MAG: DNA alkylation repair protein [Planctomycetota bacterium]